MTVTWLVFSPLFVTSSVFSHDISKTDAARITKLDVEMFRNASWGQKVKGQGYESTGVVLCTLVSAGFFSWLRCTVVERRSLTGELSLSHARPAADG